MQDNFDLFNYDGQIDSDCPSLGYTEERGELLWIG